MEVLVKKTIVMADMAGASEVEDVEDIEDMSMAQRIICRPGKQKS